MSGFGGPHASFDDAEIERQLQEEFRRRQALQQAGVGHPQVAFSALAAARARQQQQDYVHAAAAAAGGQPFMLSADPSAAAAAYGYNRAAAAAVYPHHVSPYARVPYVAMADARAYQAAAAAQVRSPQEHHALHHRAVQQQQQQQQQQVAPQQLAQLYAVQQRQQQHAVQQAVANNYVTAYGTTLTSAATQQGMGDPQRYYTGLATVATSPTSGTTAVVGYSSPGAAASNPSSATPNDLTRSQEMQQHQTQFRDRNAMTPGGTGASGSAALNKQSPPILIAPKTPTSNNSVAVLSHQPPMNKNGPGSAKGKAGSAKKKNAAAAAAAAALVTGEIMDEDDDVKSGLPVPTRSISKDGLTVIEDGDKVWYTGSVPLGLEDDKYWLSELQVYLRAHFAEAFGATEEDIAAPMHGRNKPIALGQVGIRCTHCKNDNPAERGQQSTSYPSLISGIYNSVQQMLRLHLDCCLSMPAEVRAQIEKLKISCSSRGGRKQYWIDSAKRLGLVDTPHGIHFGRDPLGPLPPLTGPSVNSKEGRNKKKNPPKSNPEVTPPEQEGEPEVAPPPLDTRPLVFPEDKPLISDYLYLTLEQMAPCLLMEADRVGCYKTRRVGFPGLACKHCVGQAGCGRYFPASEASLSQTTTSQTIMNHVRNCRRCPIEIRESLEIMKRNRMGPDGKRADKPKHGGRKVFFHRLWCRIQGLPFEEGKGEPRDSKKKKRAGGRKKKRSDNGEDSEMDSEDEEEEEDDDNDEDGDAPAATLSSEDEETESEDDSVAEDGGEAVREMKSKSKRKLSVSSPPETSRRQAAQWHEGCVRLTKTDDPHWLSEMECFARSDLVEAFTLKKKDYLDGYGGRKDPAVGQVGVRCIFCKSLDPSERPTGYMAFPDSLSSLHAKVTDLIRLHFTSCSAMPDDARETFKALRGFDAKVANDDSLQYWVDSARDIGLSNTPPAGPRAPGAWGITFRRDPLQPSPADELDLEATNGATSNFGKNSLIHPDDRGLCTDQVMLLLRQMRPCRFRKSDRRSGPGSRGRDRAMGFPGLCCMHCAGRNTLGRYFPVSAKNLTDSTTNSMQAHVSSCSQCPEPIKASLAYLGHRSILQKAELSGSWKKTFFKKIWDRLHVERGWTSIDEEPGGDQGDHEPGEEDEVHAEAEDIEEDEAKDEDNDGDGGSGSENEEMGEQMNALIKAAAIWLTEQDAATDSARASRGRSLPAKRPATLPTSRGSRGTTSLPTKRRRVNY